MRSNKDLSISEFLAAQNIKPMVNWYDDWFTVELFGRYAKAVYFRSEDVVYFTIVPVENGNKHEWAEVDYAF